MACELVRALIWNSRASRRPERVGARRRIVETAGQRAQYGVVGCLPNLTVRVRFLSLALTRARDRLATDALPALRAFHSVRHPDEGIANSSDCGSETVQSDRDDMTPIGWPFGLTGLAELAVGAFCFVCSHI